MKLTVVTDLISCLKRTQIESMTRTTPGGGTLYDFISWTSCVFRAFRAAKAVSYVGFTFKTKSNIKVDGTMRRDPDNIYISAS